MTFREHCHYDKNPIYFGKNGSYENKSKHSIRANTLSAFSIAHILRSSMS
jgi:hypothetical protein